MSETVTDAGAAGGEQQSASVADAAPAEASIRDTLAQAYDEAQQREEDAPGIGHNGGPEMEQEARARAPDGKFAPKAQAAAVEKIAPPEGWNAPGVDWNRLPRSVQESIVAREQQFQETLSKPDPVRAMVQQYAPAFQRRGVDPSIGLKGLLDTYVQLETQPAQTLAWLAERYGFAVYDPRNPPKAQQQQVPEWVDPQVELLQKELAAIKSHISTAQQQQIAQQQMALARAQQEVQSEVSSFAQGKPHFQAVASHMAALVRDGLAKDLDDAYQQAVWANPQTRAAIQEDQRKAQEAERAQKAKAAQRAGSINVRSSPGTTPSAPRDIRASLEAAYDAIAAN